MTAQVPERIVHRGRELILHTEPLAPYFRLSGNSPAFEASSSALWRGYVGQWEITGERLYLVGVKGRLQDGRQVMLETFFPGFPRRVFAHWYTGTLKIPDGDLLRYAHMGYGSTYERDIFIRIKRGIVLDERTQSNEQEDLGEDENDDVLF